METTKKRKSDVESKGEHKKFKYEDDGPEEAGTGEKQTHKSKNSKNEVKHGLLASQRAMKVILPKIKKETTKLKNEIDVSLLDGSFEDIGLAKNIVQTLQG